MKPPKPTTYKHGDTHANGKIFRGYEWQSNRWKETFYFETNMFDIQIKKMVGSAKTRAIAENIPFDIDVEYIKSIATSICPVFGLTLNWGEFGNKTANKNRSPSLDKVKPEWGYIKGNVCIISNLANVIKQDIGYKELYKVADWLHNKIKEVEKNVKPEQLTSIPTRTSKVRKDRNTRRTVFTAGPRQDSDNTYNHIGTISGQDADYCTQTRGGDSMGHGD